MLLRRIEPRLTSRHLAVWAISELQGPALVTFAVAMRPRPAAALWRELHAHQEPMMPRATTPDAPPPHPWLAVMLHLPALMPPHPALDWLGDAERCIAWAWIDRIWSRQ